jgi:hypothetical protein
MLSHATRKVGRPLQGYQELDLIPDSQVGYPFESILQSFENLKRN